VRENVFEGHEKVRIASWARPLWLSLLLGINAAMLLYAPPLSAIPAWSRRYGAPCGLCHDYPSLQLTGQGLDFFRRGHRLKGDTFDKDFAHLLSAHIEWEYDVVQGESTAFQKPAFHFHSGGAVSSHFSAYVDGNVGEGNLETAYVQYTAERGDDAYFTARGGKISPTLVRNYGNGLMASASTPLVFTDAALGSNPFTLARDSFGLDVAGRWKSFFVQAGVVNGEDVPGQASVGNHKDVFVSAEYALPDGVSGVGVLYYRGGYDIGDPDTGFLFDEYDRIGFVANYTKDRFRIAGAYLWGKDRIETLTNQDLRGWYAQADVHPVPFLVPFARHDDATAYATDETVRTQKCTLGSAIRAFETEITGGKIVLEVSRTHQGGVYSTSGLINLLWIF
jgi:hypothetical protein